jgi:hypothetical protein
VIQSEFDNGESSESIGFSHCQFGLVVQALDDAPNGAALDIALATRILFVFIPLPGARS